MRTMILGIRRMRGAINPPRQWFLALVYCMSAAAVAQAQSISGRIAGTVTDETGAAVRNASVTVTNEGTGAQRRATSDENGFYVAPELPVGLYTIRVEGRGFAPATRTRVKVDVSG